MLGAGWPTSLAERDQLGSVKGTRMGCQFASPTAKAMGHPPIRFRMSTAATGGGRYIIYDANLVLPPANLSRTLRVSPRGRPRRLKPAARLDCSSACASRSPRLRDDRQCGNYGVPGLGSVTRKHEPLPRSEVTEIVPPMTCTRPCAMASPSPVAL